jgi:hypothetical protein
MAKTLVGALRVTLGLDSAEFAAGASKAQGIGQKLARSMKGIGLATAGIGTGLALAVQRTINAADNMGKAAQKFGLPVEELSRLKYAADLSDVSLETLGTGLSQLSKKMAGVSAGGKSQVALFEKLGVAVVDTDGKLRSTEAVFQDLAGAFAAMEDGPAKTALAMEVFGRSGAQLLPLLNSGTLGLQEMAAEANALGIVIGSDMVESSEEFNDNLTRIGQAINGLLIQVTAALAPSLASISEWVIETVKAFRTLSPEVQSIIGWVIGLTATLAPLIIGLGFFFSALGTLMTPLRLLGSAIGLLLTPIGLKAAAIALLGLAIYQLLPTMEEWKKFVEDLGTIWNNLDIVAGWVIDSISEAITGLIDGALTWLGEKLGIPSEQMEIFKQAAWDAIEAVKQGFLDLPSNIIGAFETIKTGIAEAWETIKTSIGGAIDWIIARWDELVGKLQGAIQVARDVGTAISEALTLGQGTAAGAALGDGLIAGVLNGRSGAAAAGMSLGASAAEGLRNVLGINSPSRVAAGFGLNVAEGLAQGMNEGKDLVGQAAAGMGDVAAGAMKTVGDLGSRIGDMFATAATNVLTGVQSLREAVGQLLQQVAQLLINSAMKSLFGNIFDGLNIGGGVPGYASGTMNAAAGWAMVGEAGPELVRMRGGERVYDARRTDRMMGGGGEGGGPSQVTSNVYLDGELIRSQIETFEGEQAVGRVMRRLGVKG